MSPLTVMSFFHKKHSHLKGFTVVTNACGSLPQPTACRASSCSLSTTTEGNQAHYKVYMFFNQELRGVWGEQLGNNISLSVASPTVVLPPYRHLQLGCLCLADILR